MGHPSREREQMANLVKLTGDRAEFPFHSRQYSITPPAAKLQDGLEAYQALKLDLALQSLPLARRREVTRFLRQFGELLFRTLFPDGALAPLGGNGPLLLELGQDWSAYPWELLHDGQRWLALDRGVLRYTYQPLPGAPEVDSAAQRLRVLGVSAIPLPLNPDSRVGRETARFGTRFISSLNHLADTEDGSAPFLYRTVEHASLSSLEAALARSPHVLIYSGFASEEGWYLESEGLTAQAAGWEWLLRQFRGAVERGLRLIVLNDSLGLAQPITAVTRTRDLLRAGVPAVIRIEGRQARSREQDYLRTLLRHLAGGHSIAESHNRAIRRLFARFEEGWDWSFVRLYPKALPPGGDSVPPARPPGSRLAAQPGSASNPVLSLEHDAPPAAVQTYEIPPTPPIFCGRRRFFGRHAELRQLADALNREEQSGSPLVFLSGGAGSGKTMIALELARRMRGRFRQVLYLHDRGLLPDPSELMPAEGAASSAGPPGLPLFAEVTRHLPAPGAHNGALDDWKEAILHYCGDGVPRLLVLDRLEHRPGYEALCAALKELPPACRVLILSRGKPPLVPGTYITQPPASVEELEGIFGEALLKRLHACDDQGALLELCRSDLFAARLLRRAPRLPPFGRLPEIVDAPENHGLSEGASGAPASGLPALLVEAAMPLLAEELLEVLRVLALFPSLVHGEVLSQACDLDPAGLRGALRELQWLGWVDAYDGERYFALHPRIHATVAALLMNRAVLARQRARLLRVYLAYLARMAEQFDGSAAGFCHFPPPLLAWARDRGEGEPAERIRLLHRLGVERVNLAELALLLTEDADWRSLAQLAEQAEPLGNLQELEALISLLNHCLLVAAETQGDATLQAQALNNLAAPMLNHHRAEKARPLLERSLNLLSATAGWHVLAQTYLLLSRCYELMGRLEAAGNLLWSAVELAQKLGNADELVSACRGLARIWARQGDQADPGERYLTRQVHYLRQSGRDLQAALVMRSLAELLFWEGRGEEALKLLEEVLDRCRALDNPREAAATLLRLAECRVHMGDEERALATLGEAGEVAGGDVLDAEQQGRILSGICRLFEQRNQPRRALEGYLRMRELVKETGDREALIGVLDRIGGLYYQLGEQAKSTQCYEERLHLQAAVTAT